MQFFPSLIKARLLKRYKRFLADMQLENGSIITAHCANPGAMLGLTAPDNTVWLSRVPEDSSRKLRYSWEMVEIEGTIVGVNTNRPNILVKEALQNKQIPELAGYNSIRREVKYGPNSRIDFLLENPTLPPCYVEVKNVHLKRNNRAEFPDCVTARGAKHLSELAEVVKKGANAYLLYVVQRNDCTSFSIASDLDPFYAESARKACTNGVKSLCYQCHINPFGIEIATPLKIHAL